VEKFFPKVPNSYPRDDENPFSCDRDAKWLKREKFGSIETKKADPFDPASFFARNVPRLALYLVRLMLP
jgi:hypothetical protein